MTTQLIDYRPAEHDSLLQAWLQAPHVIEGWGETSLASALDATDGGSCRIVVHDGEPVGFLRWHPLSRDELDAAGLVEIPADGFDLDLLVGSAAHLGRGVGTQALREAEAFLRATCAPPFFTLCTKVGNERALRCYRRAGYTVVRTFREAGQDYFFLRKDAAPASSDRH